MTCPKWNTRASERIDKDKASVTLSLTTQTTASPVLHFTVHLASAWQQTSTRIKPPSESTFAYHTLPSTPTSQTDHYNHHVALHEQTAGGEVRACVYTLLLKMKLISF
jgi:hypothetical protein